MKEIETVARPVPRKGRAMSPFTAATLETAESGTAVRIPIAAPETVEKLRGRVSTAARYRGLTLHVYRDGPDHIIAWCEPRRPRAVTPRGVPPAVDQMAVSGDNSGTAR